MAASLLLLCGCGSGTINQTVYVQSVGDILGYDTTASQFSGVVESSKAQKIEKDDDKTIDEVKTRSRRENPSSSVITCKFRKHSWI